MPVISSDGDTEPSSTSLMRLVFSVKTAFMSCGTDVTTKKNSRNTAAIGTITVRTSSCLAAGRHLAVGVARPQPEVLGLHVRDSAVDQLRLEVRLVVARGAQRLVERLRQPLVQIVVRRVIGVVADLLDVGLAGISTKAKSSSLRTRSDSASRTWSSGGRPTSARSGSNGGRGGFVAGSASAALRSCAAATTRS